ncbi:hypothetical protein LOY87_006678 [Ophidiomyces ophidiicola]|nr:hypothetical protein LOY87_006678 [Ophidiomyces ophidiicola]
MPGARRHSQETPPGPPPPPAPRPGAVRATGLCGSDLHYFHDGRNGDRVVRAPLVLGHECTGRVVALHADVAPTSHLRVGDRVALEVGVACRRCALCRTARPNLCRAMQFRSSAATLPHRDGTLMDTTNHPARLCHALPDSVSDLEAALIEPLAVCMHAIRRSTPPDPTTTATVYRALGEDLPALVLGAGAVGLLLAAALAATQPFTRIVVADIDRARLDIAARLPVPAGRITTHLFPPSPDEPPSDDHDDAAAQARAAALPAAGRFTHLYECTGAVACVRTAIHAAAPGARIALVGMGGAAVATAVPLAAAALREVDLVGVLRYDDAAYPAAIALMASGRLRGVAECVVTHTVDLADDGGYRGFRLAGARVDERGCPVVKVVVLSGGLNNR